ncbi:MAG: ribonuclease HII, partial [Gillisia sp.]
SENNLVINNTEINLDYGLYTQPKIFELGNKTYITVTDTQAQRIFVFDKNATLLPGFPVYGNSAIDMRLESGGNLVLTVKGEENTVLVYRM